MIVTYHGKHFLKLQRGDMTLAINPPAKSLMPKVHTFGAQVMISSILGDLCGGVETVTYGNQKPFVVDGPGEYEINGLTIRGVGVPQMSDGNLQYVTVYYFTFDDMRICILGPLSQAELPREVKEMIEEVDIVCIPVGGGETLDASTAYALAVKLEPKIIIPLDYDTGKDAGALQALLKDAGTEKVEPLEKFTVKAKDIAGKQAEVVVLEKK